MNQNFINSMSSLEKITAYEILHLPTITETFYALKCDFKLKRMSKRTWIVFDYNVADINFSHLADSQCISPNAINLITFL